MRYNSVMLALCHKQYHANTERQGGGEGAEVAIISIIFLIKSDMHDDYKSIADCGKNRNYPYTLID